MIKPINITPLNTTTELRYECENCNAFGVITLKDSICNTDDSGNIIEDLSDYVCPKCDRKLSKGAN